MAGTVEIGSVEWQAQTSGGSTNVAIAISDVTNNQLYEDAKIIARDLLRLKRKCEVYKERLYYIGIPNDPANGGAAPVVGFVDTLELTKLDVTAALSIAVDTDAYVSPGRVQACAQILRNSAAE